MEVMNKPTNAALILPFMRGLHLIALWKTASVAEIAAHESLEDVDGGDSFC
jgi:hypothetical protein